MCIACEWAEQASLLEKWRESRALRDLKDDPPERDADAERFPADAGLDPAASRDPGQV